MIIGAVADLHFSGSRHEEQSSLLRKVLGSMASRGVEVVLCAGDIVDNPKMLDRWAYPSTLVRAILDPIEEAGIPWVIVAGNHDETPAGQCPALDILRACPLITAFSRTVDRHSIGDVDIVAVPWQMKAQWMASGNDDYGWDAHCRNLFEKTVSSMWRKESAFKVLVSHTEVEGSVATPYKVVVPGTSFMVTNSSLNRSGADAILLGHVHYRQGHYLGALWQNNFGEEGNPDGWLYLNTESGDRRFFPLDAPKYYSVNLEHYVPGRYRKEDRIKLLVEGDDARRALSVMKGDLPANVEIKAVKQESSVLSRTEAAVTHDMPPSVLLGAWMASKNLDPDYSLFEMLEELQSAPEMGSVDSEGMSGSLDRIHRIRISGFGPHADTDHRVDGGDRWRVIGSNGKGKSFFLEAVVACLYGKWAHQKRGTLRDTLSEDVGELLVEFRSEDRVFEARRILKVNSKGITHDAYLSEILEDGSRRALASKKPTDFQQEINKLLGPWEMFLAGAFASQDNIEDFISADPGARMEFARRLFGLRWCDDLAAAASSRASDCQKWLEARPDPESDEPEFRKRKEDAEIALEEAKADMERLSKDASREEEIVNSLALEVAELRSKTSEIPAVKSAWVAASAKAAEMESSLKEMENSDPARAYLLKEMDSLKEELADCERRESRIKELYDVRSERDRIKAEHASVQSQISLLKRQREREVENLKKEIEAHEKRLAEMQERVSVLPTVGCARMGFLPCRYIDDVRKESDYLHEFEQTAADLRDALGSGMVVKDTDSKIAEMERSLKALVESMPEDPGPEIRDMQNCSTRGDITSRLLKVQDKLRLLEDASGSASKIVESLNDVRLDMAEIAKRLDALRETESVLADIDRSYVQARDKLAVTRKSVADSYRKFGVCEAEVGALQQEEERRNQARHDRAETLASWGRWKTLSEAFGRSGIPQLVISASLRPLQDLIDDITEKDFDGDFKITLDTQRESRDGSVLERFMLWFSQPGRKTFDAASCSGGYRQAVRMIWRVAVVLHNAYLSRHRYRVLFMDEISANQDSVMQDRTVSMIIRMSERFKQTFTVSHNESLLAEIPDTIEFR